MKPYYESAWVTIYHGDCLEVMQHLDDSSADLVLTDLPYGMTDCAWDSPLPLDDLWRLWRHVLRGDGVVALTASQPFSSTLVASNPARFKHEWIWRKNAGSNFGTVKRHPMKEHESILIFSWGNYFYSPIMQERAASGLSRVQSGIVNYATRAEVYQSGGLMGAASSFRPDLRYPSSVQTFNRERGLHPTQKPVALMDYIIRTYTDGEWSVLDPCMGSGSTLVAAQQARRYSVGIESDERYCEIAARRIEAIDMTPQLFC